MRRILSISEVLETLATPVGAVEVLATGEADYDEGEAQLAMRLDSLFRPVEAKASGHGLSAAILPRSDTVRIKLDWAEALPAARDIFQDWVKRVHQSVTNAKNP